jgi:hypothetical protein
VGQYARLRRWGFMAMYLQDEESDHRKSGIALETSESEA